MRFWLLARRKARLMVRPKWMKTNSMTVMVGSGQLARLQGQGQICRDPRIQKARASQRRNSP